MKGLLKLCCFLAFVFLLGNFAYALPSGDLSQFEKANMAYKAGKFDEASALYKALAEKYPADSTIQFNLGNALQKKGELGGAILAYERARLTQPRNADILHNLNYVRGLLEYRIDDKRNELIKIAETFLSYFTQDEIIIFGLLVGFVFFASWAGVLFFKADASWGFFRKLLLLLTLAGFTVMGMKTVQTRFFRESIIMTKDAQVYYGPSVTEQQAFRLGEGLKVFIVDTREGWNRILIPSGESGWIQQEQAASIKKV
jgi:tetratricopeptide (TPR) repeat protein